MEKIRIMLVDDDKDDRHFFAKAINHLQLNVELFQEDNCNSCLEFLRDNTEDQIDIIFLDLNMPVMNGFECLECIKEEASYENIIIAIYSTSSAEKDITKTFELGANVFINKPTSFQDLKKALQQVIETNWSYKMNQTNKEHFVLKV